MCNSFVVNQLKLGNRELGWELWNGKEVIEMTSKQIINGLLAGERIYGLKLSDDNRRLEMDEDGFFTINMMSKMHINNLVPMKICEGNISSVFFIVISKLVNGKEDVYELISSRFEHLEVSKEKLCFMFEMHMISGGAKYSNGEICLPDYVEREEKQEKKENKTKNNKIA